MLTPEQSEASRRTLFVFASAVSGREEALVGLLAKNLDRRRYAIDVVVCLRQPGIFDPMLRLEAMGVPVDRTPYYLSMEATVSYLASRIPAYDLVISCQNVADIYPALEQLHAHPPLIEYGGSVSEALAGPKHFTSRYVSASQSIRDAAVSQMPGREADAVVIPTMVDLEDFDVSMRTIARAEHGIADDVPVVGFSAAVDPVTGINEFIAAAAIVKLSHPNVQFVVIGGKDVLLPEYAQQLGHHAVEPGLGKALRFLDNRANMPVLLGALDILVCRSQGDEVPDGIAEAGVSALPVIVTAANGSADKICDEHTGLLVSLEPAALSAAIISLIDDPALRARLGVALRERVIAEHSVQAVLPQWTRLFDRAVVKQPAPAPSLFKSFLQGGFECSSHRRAHDRRRIDVIAATGHDRRAVDDYACLADHGIITVRDGLRWHLIEQVPGAYDWASLDHQLAAARSIGSEVIWDLMHYGWPDDIDIWSAQFPHRFAAFAAAAASYIAPRSPGCRFYAPINEISFLAWGGGDVAYLNPFARGRGFELKVQLVRASVAAMRAIRQADPAARFVHPEPLINIVVHPERPEEAAAAEGHRQAQFQAWDMIAGRSWPQLGGAADLLDIVGVNYYNNNQWVHGGSPLLRGEAGYRPFHQMLAEVHARYGRPLFVAETGIEGDERASWFAYIRDEVTEARRRGVPVEGICLYPILDHPGWDDDRHCPNGLIGMDRKIHSPLADLIRG